MDDKKRKRHEKNNKRHQKKLDRKQDMYNRVVSSSKSTLVKSMVKESLNDKSVNVFGTPSQKLRESLEMNDGNIERVGKEVLQWMIHPTPVKEFMESYHEKKPLLVRRCVNGQSNYYSGLFSKKAVEHLFEEKKLHYTRDFSLTQYRNGARTTLKEDESGPASSKTVWKLFDGPEKASIRILRPHEHSDYIWKIIAAYEGYFGCGGGSNLYLTPKSSQGFAPHYDDIDAYILQLEGKKDWSVYETKSKSPRKTKKGGNDSDDEDDELERAQLFPELPRYSSRDFTPEEITEHMKPIITVTLEPGDLLYVPRGFVHQAKASNDIHSLHVTVSTGQLNTWSDFISEAVTHAIERTCRSDLLPDCASLRKGLPRDYLDYMGVMHSEKDDQRRETFGEEVVKLVTEHVLSNIDCDLIADRMAAKFQYDRHRPLHIVDAKEFEDAENENISFDRNSSIVLRAKGVATLTIENETLVLYHSCRNTRVYHETPPRGLEFELEDSEIIDPILMARPNVPIALKSLEGPSVKFEDIERVVAFLLSEGIVRLA